MIGDFLVRHTTALELTIGQLAIELAYSGPGQHFDWLRLGRIGVRGSASSIWWSGQSIQLGFWLWLSAGSPTCFPAKGIKDGNRSTYITIRDGVVNLYDWGAGHKDRAAALEEENRELREGLQRIADGNYEEDERSWNGAMAHDPNVCRVLMEYRESWCAPCIAKHAIAQATGEEGEL